MRRRRERGEMRQAHVDKHKMYKEELGSSSSNGSIWWVMDHPAILAELRACPICQCTGETQPNPLMRQDC